MLGKIFNFDALLFTAIGGLLTYRFFSRGAGQPTVQLIVPAVAVLVAINSGWVCPGRRSPRAACLLFGASTFYVMRIDGFTKLGLAVLAACLGDVHLRLRARRPRAAGRPRRGYRR